jgi:hypothetical protein
VFRDSRHGGKAVIREERRAVPAVWPGGGVEGWETREGVSEAMGGVPKMHAGTERLPNKQGTARIEEWAAMGQG